MVKYNKNRTIYNFFNERKWTMLISGYRVKNSTLNWLYVAFIFVFLTTFVILSLGAVYVAKDKVVKLLACHGIILSLGLIWALMFRTIFNKLHLITSNEIENGIYHYEDEEADECMLKIKENGIEYLRKMTTYTARALIFGGFCNFILAPAMKYLTFDVNISEKDLNPYIPLPLYFPFDTSSPLGFCFAYIIVALYGCFLVTILTALNEVYVTCTVQLNIQFEILNYSLNSIEKRAFSKQLKWKGTPTTSVKKEDLKLRIHDYVLICLQENIKHHQALIRFKKLTQPFLGALLLGIFMLASLVMAMAVIVILESPEFTRASEFLLTFGTEMAFIFTICLYGEQVHQESSRVMYSLYNSPWIGADKRFTLALLVTMSNSLRPLSMTSLIIPVTASVESFASIISTMYQIVNVVRNF